MGKELGRNYCVCLADSVSAPAFVPLIGAKDIKVSNKPGASFDSTDRAGALPGIAVVKTEIPTRRSVEVSFGALWNGGTGLTALRDAFLTGAPLLLAALDKLPGEGGAGYFGEWCVTKFPMKFPLADGQQIDITLQPHGAWADLAVAAYVDDGSAGTPEEQAPKKRGQKASVNDSDDAPISAIKDFSFDASWELVKSDDRSTEFDMVQPSIFTISADIEFQWNPDDEQLVAILEAAEAGDPITLSLLDGAFADTGSWGPKADWAVTDYPRDASLADGQMCKLKLAPHGNYTTPLAFLTT